LLELLEKARIERDSLVLSSNAKFMQHVRSNAIHVGPRVADEIDSTNTQQPQEDVLHQIRGFAGARKPAKQESVQVAVLGLKGRPCEA